MHLSLWGVSHLKQEKLLICNRILGHVADRNYIAFIDSVSLDMILYLQINTGPITASRPQSFSCLLPSGLLPSRTTLWISWFGWFHWRRCQHNHSAVAWSTWEWSRSVPSYIVHRLRWTGEYQGILMRITSSGNIFIFKQWGIQDFPGWVGARQLPKWVC